jgi:hypothetical protein
MSSAYFISVCGGLHFDFEILAVGVFRSKSVDLETSQGVAVNLVAELRGKTKKKRVVSIANRATMTRRFKAQWVRSGA